MFKFLKNIPKLIAALQLIVSPLLIGLAIGALVYFPNKTITTLIIGCAIAGLGLLLGVLWAMRVHRKTGTVEFMSRVMATPELDELTKAPTSEGEKD